MCYSEARYKVKEIFKENINDNFVIQSTTQKTQRTNEKSSSFQIKGNTN